VIRFFCCSDLRRPALLRTAVALLLGAIFSATCRAESTVDFNRDIRPLFSNRCLTCHGPDEAERASELRLDTEAGSRVDLGGYAAIVPGDPANSELLTRLTTDDPDLQMPPAGSGIPLSTAEIEMVRQWIVEGAPYAKHWSYEVPSRPELPIVDQSHWPLNPIDHFILARLESVGLEPSPAADRLTLARRVALDLTGLPPSWSEAQAFVADPRVDAYERYVDAQLAKQSFGERWARVWLDLARYADSAGYADDPPRTIWAYRDHVIRALNDNQPFDQFTIEQIAGDLLPNPTESQLIATAFHRNTMTNNEGGTNDEEFRNVAVVDRVNTTMAVWMGTTMACAQCHTHKYDPITQDEYFQFLAFFNQSQDSDQRDERPTLDIFSEDQKMLRQQISDQIEQHRLILNQSTPALLAAQQSWLESLAATPRWLPQVPAEISAESRQLKVDNDGWIHGRGAKAESDRYHITYPTTPGTLTAVRIDVPKYQADNFVLSQVKATWTADGAESKPARFVRIELPGSGKMIHLAEIEVFSGNANVAPEGTVKQSSTGFDGKAQRAIDGNTDGNFQNGSVTHTDPQTNPWIEIDLRSVMTIDKVVVWNRTDGGPTIRDRIRGMRLSLLDQDRQQVWETTSPEFPQPSQTYWPSQKVDIRFADAAADFHQAGFSPTSLLADRPGLSAGWAVAPRTGQPHELTLTLAEPLKLSDGDLQLELVFASEQKQMALDHFRVSLTDDQQQAQWAQLPPAIRQIVRTAADVRSDQDRAQLAAHYRSIAPALADVRTQLAEAEKKLAAITPLTTVPVMRQLAESDRRVTRLQLRGDYKQTDHAVAEGTPAAFHPLPAGPRDRLTLARWLVDDQNPLTARVTVNRHWEEIFGTGIVATSEEFGSQGELPSHPELLDWLAVELRDSGWNLKQLLKLLVTSATYRQSSALDESKLSADPDNRLYGSGPRFRASAEMVRDQALFVSGLLSDKMYGPPVRPPQPELGLNAAFGGATDWTTSDGEDRYRRGLYTTWRRSSPYPSLAQFDAPNREVCTIRRIRTNTPLQALVTLNDPVYIEAAQALARKLIAAGDSPQDRIRSAIQSCLIREPTPDETSKLMKLADDAQQKFAADPAQAMQFASEPLGNLPPDADAAEYAAWTLVANVILNLDEMLMKR
jgi:hypothetical protein